MLNFLQQKNKKQIIFEYLLRVSIYLLLFIFVSTIILISFFIPSFFFTKYKNDTVTSQLLSIKQKNSNLSEDPIVFIKKINNLAPVLSNNVSPLTYSDIVSKIVSLKNNDIKILSITITKETNTGGKRIILGGVANTRDSLTLFNKDLESDGFFNQVTFPVSNFIKSLDAEFSATLIL